MTDRNILVVMSDDHGQWCLGEYGNEEVRTPTIDYLAQSGVRMENASCPSPVCSPARTSFFTGLRPSQHGVHDWIGSEEREQDWLGDLRTLPDLLGGAGYTTGLTGKWHCGRGRERADFDYTATRDGGDWPVNKHSLAHDRQATDRAVEFLRDEREDDAPFFLFVGFTGTHGGWSGEPERLVDQYRGSPFDDIPDDTTYRYARTNVIRPDDPDEVLANYYAAVQGIDEQVGRLVDELDDQGELDDTLVVYTADHGNNIGHHGIWGKGNGTVPQNMLDESVSVPLILSQHRDVEGGQVREEFVDHCDLFQTLLDAAAVDSPDGPDYPGRSLWGHVSEVRGDPDWTQTQFSEYGDVRMIRTETHKLVVRYPDGPDLLFDLDRDPRETTNVIDRPEYADIEATLRETLEDEFDRYSSPDHDGKDVDALPSYNGGSEAWDQGE